MELSCITTYLLFVQWRINIFRHHRLPSLSDKNCTCFCLYLKLDQKSPARNQLTVFYPEKKG